MLRRLLEEELKRRGMTVREAAKEIGVSHTTIYDIIKKDRPMQVETANLICKWLGVSLTTAVSNPSEQDQTAAVIAVLLRKVPELGRVFQEAATAVTDGEMKPEDFLAVIEFAAFQIQKRKELSKEREQERAEAAEGAAEQRKEE